MRNKIKLLLVLSMVSTACTPPESKPQTESAARIENVSAPESISVSTPGANASEPAIAAGNRENVFAVWVEHTAKKEADLMIREFDAAGRATGEAVRVNPQPGAVKAWYGDPPTVRVGRDGAVYVGWTARSEDAKGAGNILYLSVSRDDGKTFAAPVKVNDDTAPASHGMHSLAIGGDGRVYVAWLDERYLNAKKERAAARDDAARTYRFEKAAFFHHDPITESKPKPTPEPKIEPSAESETEPNAELYFAVSSDGGKTFSANKKLAENACPCCKTSLLAASDGNIYVGWRHVLAGDFRHIAVAASPGGGNDFSAPVVVSDDRWQISACPVSGAALAEDADKTVKVAWFTAGKAGVQGIYSSESKDGGKTFAPRRLVSEDAVGGTPSIFADKTKKIGVVWTDNGEIVANALPDENASAAPKRGIMSGEFPETAVVGERVFVIFADKKNQTSAIKMSVIE